MDVSRFYPGALLDETAKPAESPPIQQQQSQAQSQNSSGLNQNMLMSLLPMLMGGGDVSSILSGLTGLQGAANTAGSSTDNQMINTLTTMLRNRSMPDTNTPKQKPPQQYTETDDYIFD